MNSSALIVIVTASAFCSPITYEACASQRLPIGTLSERSELKLTMYILPIDATFPSAITIERFEAMKENGDIHYVLHVQETSLVQRFANRLSIAPFFVTQRQYIDIRYRFDFQENGHILHTFYADAFGNICTGSRVLSPKENTFWPREGLRLLLGGLAHAWTP